MMDNNQEDRTTISSSHVPIDYIDLTNESPIRATQSLKRPFGVLASDNSISTGLSNTSTHKSSVSSSNKTQCNVPVSTSTRKKHNKVTKDTGEIVTIDDTIIIPDDDKHYITESDNGEPLPLTCPICFELICSKLKPTTTRCGHIFCTQCLETHLLKSKKCPTCKSNITLKSCTRLYL